MKNRSPKSADKRILQLEKELAAKNRELQIEAALEKVRSRSLAMHKSDELKEVIIVVFEKLKELGLDFQNSGIQLYREGSKDIDQWVASTNILSAPVLTNLPYIDKDFGESEIIRGIWIAKEKGKKIYNKNYSLDEKNKFFEYAAKYNDFDQLPEKAREAQKQALDYTQSLVAERHSALWVDSYSGQTISAEGFNVLERTAKVFDQAYTRFLDLQKAEAQAREAKIEAALEKVRSRSLAMHHSNELEQVVASLFDRLVELGLLIDGALIFTFDKEIRSIQLWIATVHLPAPVKIELPFEEEIENNAIIKDLWNAVEKGEHIFNKSYSGKTKNDYFRYVQKNNESKIPEPIKRLELEKESWTAYFVAEKNSMLGFDSWSGPITSITDEDFRVLKRFAKVFEQAYVRFLDLQKAEAQAREGQIQLALERVRARAMAMQKSDELKELIATVYIELGRLDFLLNRADIEIYDPKTRDSTWWMFHPESSEPIGLLVKYHELPPYLAHLKGWEEREAKWLYILEGEVKKTWDKFLFTQTELSKLPGVVIANMRSVERAYLYASFNNFGCLSIATLEPITDEQFDILLRFAKVFDLTYTRFNDLKQAEAQAREAQIEAALERVRSRTMAMQHSEDLTEVANLLFQQVQVLGVPAWSCGFNIWDEKENCFTGWMSSEGILQPPFKIPFSEVPTFNRFYESRKNGEVFYVEEVGGQALVDQYQYMRGLPGFGKILDDFLESGFTLPTFQINNVANFLQGNLIFITSENVPEAHDIFKRFAKVFEQTYTRFLDLQKAEAQAREASIEAALEKIRSRSLAMLRSDELKEVVAVLFDKLKELGLVFDGGAGIHLFRENSRDAEIWVRSPEVDEPICSNLPYDEDFATNPIIIDVWKAKDTGEHILNKTYSFQEKNNYFDYVFKHNDTSILPEPVRRFIKGTESYTATFIAEKNSLLGVNSWTGQLFSESDILVFKRVAKVFEQAYVRFLDLQKAEAQAREATIEAALERIRAKTMAMHESAQLAETAKVFFEQFDLLGQIPDRMSIGIFKEETNKLELWVTDQHGNQVNNEYFFSLDEPTSIAKIYKAWKDRKDICVVDLTGEELARWLQYVKEKARLPIDETKIKGRRVQQTAFFSKGCLLFTTHEPVKEQTMQLLVRFARVFDLTYTRFLDLQKAEAQAREATIEAALERVRSRSLAMHSSDELKEVVSVVFDRLEDLGFDLYKGAAIIMVFSNSSKAHIQWVADPIHTFARPFLVPYTEHSISADIYKAKENGTGYLSKLYAPEEKNQYFEFLIKHTDYKHLPEYAKKLLLESEQYGVSIAFEKNTAIFIPTNTGKLLSDDEMKILKRFTKVFEQVYVRFIDLQKAEANAKEAVRQASVDRVRAEIASMRTTKDLEKITPLIWNELSILHIPFIRCGVFIMNEEEQQMNVHLSTPEGEAIAAFHLPYNISSNFSEIVHQWHHKESYISRWSKEEFNGVADSLVQQGAVGTKDAYLGSLPKEGIYLHFLPFFQGMLYVGNLTKLAKEELDLIQAVADAFSTAYARYEDFNKLEAAKKQVDFALNELRATQKQLIQSEKMASLGELTAGIAHEIQNPLNFVNNFSEVNKELISEMKEEIEKGHFDEVKIIAGDIEENEEKINHHGKRADAIVKGMLQHSRASTGKKEPTDINALCDEYLRLSYHGLRAKDKSFNAEIKKNFDVSIGKINIIPQDIGRVLLNLFNNAFYAVTEKKKQLVNKQKSENFNLYQPTVSVTTSLNPSAIDGADGASVSITVSDNGNGIPEKIKEKIFQPFFTTKPTGQGTGLGLSLSYDIVKAHGGEFKVETKEGEGSEFVVELPLKEILK